MYILGKVSEVAGKVLEVCSRKGFYKFFPNVGKLLIILGKGSFLNFPKLPWERKGKGKLSVLPLATYLDFLHSKSSTSDNFRS